MTGNREPRSRKVADAKGSVWQGVARVVAWGVLSLGPNLAWEIAHAPLYANWARDPPFALAYSLIHCTLGDGAIAVATFLLVSAVLRSTRWPLTSPATGAVLVTIFGVTYTAWSEYRNVVAGHWAYTPAMPTVAGIGLTPLLQWMMTPALTLWIWRRAHR